MIKATKTRRKGAGRPLEGAEKMKPHTVRLSEDQWRKLITLGAGKWIREKLDATEWPRCR